MMENVFVYLLSAFFAVFLFFGGAFALFEFRLGELLLFFRLFENLLPHGARAFLLLVKRPSAVRCASHCSALKHSQGKSTSRFVP